MMNCFLKEEKENNFSTFNLASALASFANFKIKIQTRILSSILKPIALVTVLTFWGGIANSQVACDMIYVDAVNGNDSNLGLPTSPVKSLTKAMTFVLPSRNYIKMTSGNYTETSIINLQNGLVIDGRYTNTAGVWSKSSNTASSTTITLSGTETINNDVAHVMGFKSDGKSNWKLIDLNITTANAVGQTTSRRGKSNYAVYITNSSINYEITRCSIISGNASNGQGRNTNATLFDGKNGGNGNVGVTGNAGGSQCGYDSGGNGGNGGVGGVGGVNSSLIGGSAQNGSTGGNGGTGKNDNNSGGTASTGMTGTCSGGGGAMGTNDSNGNDSPYGGFGSSCNNNGSNGITSTTITSTYLSGYFVPGYGNNGTAGGGGGGGAGGGGAGRDTDNCDAAGGGGSGGSGGGGGGGAGAGGLGGGSSFGVFLWNAGTGGAINNSTLNTGTFGSKGLGGYGGNGGSGGVASPLGSRSGDNQANRGGQGGAGSNGGNGGNGADGTDGERIAVAVKGSSVNPTFNFISPAIAVNSSTSGGSITNSPIVSLNQIPNKICQNSVLNVTTSAASWTLPTNWEFVKYNNTAVTSEYTTASTTADITTTNTSGFYDVTANGVVFNSYLNVKSARTLPVITFSPTPACDGDNLTFSATSWGTETEYKWEIFDATNAPNKGATTNLIFSSSLASPTTNLLTATTSAKTYLIRYQVKEECCGWSIPVFETITVNPKITPLVAITSSPNANVCIGTTVSFTAVPTNGGATPAYQWKINGTNAGTNSATFATASLINSDVVSCEMTSSLTTCLTSTTANSNNVTMSMQVAGSPLSGTEAATCIVNGNSWVRFYGSTGLLLGEVNAQGNNLGLVQMNTLVGGPQFMQDCTSPTNPLYHTAYMGRTWIMSSDAYPAGSNFPSNVSVRLPYNNSELIALNNYAVSATTGNPNDDGATLANIMLTKITGATENGIANLADCPSTIRAINANSGSGTNIQAIANTQYVDFSIGQFSEFFLHKNINNSALPVTLTNFSATCEDNVTLSWTTASEQNSNRFIVEKSRDGQTWSFVATQTAAGTSNTIHNYTQSDENSWNGVTYYRLRQIDFNGAEEVYGPISVSCEGNESSMTVYPNPSSGSFTIEIASTEMYNNAQLFLTDLTGKVITTQTINVANGTTQILMDNLDLKMGTYLVTLRGADQQLKPVKVMVTK